MKPEFDEAKLAESCQQILISYTRLKNIYTLFK